MPKFTAVLPMIPGTKTTTSASLVEQVFSRVEIDTAQYDGNAVYRIEVTLQIGTSAETATAVIRQAGGSVDLNDTALTVTGTTQPKRLESTFTPVAGANQYTIWISATNAATARIAAAIIIVEQDATATKSRTSVCMQGRSSLSVTSATPVEFLLPSRFLYTAADWENATFEFHVIGSNGGSSTNTIELWDKTADASAGLVAMNIATAQLWKDTTVTLVDGHEYSIYGSRPSGACSVNMCSLVATLSALTKAQVYVPVAVNETPNLGDWDETVTSADEINDFCRHKFQMARWDTANVAAIYYEASGESGAATGDTIRLSGMGASDNGVTLTLVTGSDLPVTSTTVQRLRSGDLKSVLTDQRYVGYLQKGTTAGTLVGHVANLLIQYAAAAGAIGDEDGLVPVPIWPTEIVVDVW